MKRLHSLDNAEIIAFLNSHPRWNRVVEARLPFTAQAWEYTPDAPAAATVELMGTVVWARARALDLMIHEDPTRSPKAAQYAQEAYCMINCLELNLPLETPFEVVRRLVDIVALAGEDSAVARVAYGE